MTTIICIDYDDTIFCTNALAIEALKQGVDLLEIKVDDNLKKELLSLEDSAIEFLQKLSSYGRIWIITNSDPSWYIDTCFRFFRRLFSVISSFPVISSRWFYQKNHPISEQVTTMEWKYYTITYMLKSEVELVSIGDSYDEYHAAQKIRNEMGKITNYVSPRNVVNIKMFSSPTIVNLIDQQHSITDNFKTMIGSNKDFILQ